MLENITLGQISLALGFLVGLVAIIKQSLKPLTDFSKRIDDIEKHQDNDNKRLKRLETTTEQTLLTVYALLNHSIDNNHSDELEKRKKELEEYLVKRTNYD